MMVLPRRWSSWSTAIISMRALGSNPLAGSSNNRSCGSWINTRARPKRCCIPRLSAPISEPFFSLEPANSRFRIFEGEGREPGVTPRVAAHRIRKKVVGITRPRGGGAGLRSPGPFDGRQ